jgi:hypothetical protein
MLATLPPRFGDVKGNREYLATGYCSPPLQQVHDSLWLLKAPLIQCDSRIVSGAFLRWPCLSRLFCCYVSGISR